MSSAPSSEQGQDEEGHGKWRVNWRHVGILYAREFRAAMRDKSVVINSILIPVLLYPFLLWAGLSLFMFIRGQSEKAVARVAISDFPADHVRLRRIVQQTENLVLVQLAKPGTNVAGRIRNGEFDIYARFTTNAPAGSSLPTFKAGITYDKTLDRSTAARDTFARILEDYRESWIKREAKKVGIGAPEWQAFGIALQNVASKTQMGAFVLGMLLPIIFAVMVASGCFYPAVDTMAGERERGTWETLMSTAAQRGAILVAKYLHVVTFGGLAGTLNLAAVLFTVKPLLNALAPEAATALDLVAAWRAAPLMVLAAVLLAGFIAAGMMVFAAFAKTFKEGQAMITPFYMVIMIPMVFLQVPGIQHTPGMACIPVVNLILMMRAAVSGTLEWVPVTLTLISSLGVITLALSAAAYVLRFEEVATGSYSGSVFKFMRTRMFKRAIANEVSK